MTKVSKDCIFLSRQEVLSAIRADFHQYAPQTALFLELFPLVFGDRAVVNGTPRDDHLWFAEGGGKMVQISPKDLGRRICQALEQSNPSLDLLASVCRRVFRTEAQPARLKQSRQRGIWLRTGMNDFKCHQCGECCRNLDYYDQLTESDIERWRKHDRKDILCKVRRVKKDGDSFAYRLWERSKAGDVTGVCPWLTKIPTQNRWECRIHAVRPAVCRQYPGSRKHAEMTGCPGFRKC